MHGVKLTVTAALFLVMALFFSTPVNASLHHDHQSGHVFSKMTSKGKHAHCVLRGHSQNNPCPHILYPKRQEQGVILGPDCGGSPFPSLPMDLPLTQKISLNKEDLIQKSSLSSKYQLDSSALYLGSSINSIDHPPKR
jgi:hypothetical protein